MSLGSRDPGDRASESTERLNTVKFFDATKGFGFIKSLREIYFSASDVVGEVVAGDEVKFDLKDGRKGTVAVNVRRA